MKRGQYTLQVAEKERDAAESKISEQRDEREGIVTNSTGKVNANSSDANLARS